MPNTSHQRVLVTRYNQRTGPTWYWWDGELDSHAELGTDLALQEGGDSDQLPLLMTSNYSREGA